MNNGNSLVLGVYAVYLGAVVFSGNAGEFIQALKDDSSEFVPWLIAVFLLVALYMGDQTRAAVAPFAFLLLLNVILRNFGIIRSQIKTISGV